MAKGRKHDIYVSDEEWKILLAEKERTNKSISWILLHSHAFWLKHNPKELEDLAEEFADIRAEKEAKEMERDSGDYLGSFEKEADKLEKIKEKEKAGSITPEMADILRERTRIHYQTTREAKEKRFKKQYEKEFWEPLEKKKKRHKTPEEWEEIKKQIKEQKEAERKKERIKEFQEQQKKFRKPNFQRDLRKTLSYRLTKRRIPSQKIKKKGRLRGWQK